MFWVCEYCITSFLGVSYHFLGLTYHFLWNFVDFEFWMSASYKGVVWLFSNCMLHTMSFILLFSLRQIHKKWLSAHNAAHHDHYRGNHLEQIIFLIPIFRNDISSRASNRKNFYGCDLCFTDHLYPKSNFRTVICIIQEANIKYKVNISTHLS